MFVLKISWIRWLNQIKIKINRYKFLCDPIIKTLKSNIFVRLLAFLSSLFSLICQEHLVEKKNKAGAVSEIHSIEFTKFNILLIIDEIKTSMLNVINFRIRANLYKICWYITWLKYMRHCDSLTCLYMSLFVLYWNKKKWKRWRQVGKKYPYKLKLKKNVQKHLNRLTFFVKILEIGKCDAQIIWILDVLQRNNIPNAHYEWE